jgi:predicted RNA-binding protein YlxR (DUF448 family)
MILTFSLFWIVIKNNILYVIRTGNVDGGGLFFPSAINQTFIGLYFMEICLIGLFFLVRDAKNNAACELQGAIMVIVLLLTACYQIWLAVNFNGLYKYAPVRMEVIARKRDKEYELERLIAQREQREELSTTIAAQGRSQDIQKQQEKDEQNAKRILARLNRPLNDERLAELENRLSQVQHRIGNVLVPRRHDIEAHMMNDPISRIIMQHNDELENLDPEERDMLLSIAFTHPVLRETRPSVWIPRDNLGVSDDEVKRTREFSRDVTIDNRGAYFNKRMKVQVDKPPPDMSEFALVMAEL